MVILCWPVVEVEPLQVREGGGNHVSDLRVEMTATWHGFTGHAEGQPRDAHSLQ